MELVKRVDVFIDAITGKLVFTENPEGNAAIHRGKVTKEEFPRISDFCRFFQEGCPSTFTVSHFMSGLSADITVMSNETDERFTFRVNINDKKGIFGHYELLRDNNRWRKGEYQMFYYHWDSEINSMKLFEKVFEYFDYFNPDDKAIKILEKIYPDATEVCYRDTDWDRDQYIVKYGVSPSRRFVFQYNRNDNSVKLVGYLVSGEYRDYMETIDQLEEQIKDAQECREDLLAMQEIMDLKKAEGHPYEQAAIRERRKSEAEQKDKEDRKIAADIGRQLPRKPELMNLSTRELLNIVSVYRSTNPYHPDNRWATQYGLAEVKAELTHRPHIPNKIEGKELRRRKALGITELPKKDSRTSKKKRNG